MTRRTDHLETSFRNTLDVAAGLLG